MIEYRDEFRGMIKGIDKVLADMHQISEKLTATLDAKPAGFKDSDEGEALRDFIVDLEVSQTHLTDIKEILDTAASE